MGPYRKAICAGLIASIGFVLAGCDGLDSITDFAIFDSKKKLPGDRKPVFPEGVPGVTQGIPPQLQKGYSEEAAQPADPAAAAVEQVAAKPEAKEKPKPKVAAKPRLKPQTSTAQARPQPQAQPQSAPQPISPPAPQAQMPWPDPQTAPKPQQSSTIR
jgi:hypothetical protein